MTQSDQYLDSFRYGATDRALEYNRKMRLYKARQREMRAKINRKVKMVSIVLASGLTVFIAAGSYLAKNLEKPKEKTNETKNHVEYTTHEETLSTKPINKVNEEIVTHPKPKEENKKQDKQVKPEVIEQKKSDIQIGGNGSDEVDSFLNTSENQKYAEGIDPSDYMEATESNAGAFVYKYSSDYGVDPSIIASICYQESSLRHYDSCPGGDSYNGYGVGITQQESPSGEKVTAYNLNTEEEDVEYITMDNACDIAKNIKIGCMQWQNSINHYQGNVLLAIQSHNYGQTMLDKVLFQNYFNLDNLNNDYPYIVDNLKQTNPEIYQFLEKDYPTQYNVLSEEYPETYETLWEQSQTYWNTVKDMIYKDYSNTSWLKAVKDAHENPSKYLSNWDFENYGDGDYVEHVLSHCPNTEINYQYNGNKIAFNLETLTVASMENTNQNVR